MSFSDFEHSLIAFFKNRSSTKDYTVACSGGLDSVVLTTALAKIQPVIKFDLKVLYIHHGVDAQNQKQSDYRNRACEFVEALASELSLKFVSKTSPCFLETEAGCREFRLSAFQEFRNVLTAHHKDDFLETLVLRMIRGAGPQGLSKPFKDESLKPFLRLFKREDIEEYAKLRNIYWIEDPSNSEADALRNWVRHEWIPRLDDKMGKEGFVKSLMLISEALEGASGANYDEIITFTSGHEGFLKIEAWLGLDRLQKQSTIAHILLKVRKAGYTHGQIEEVVKQLDQNKKDTTFRSGKIAWAKSSSKVLFRLDL